tara:strand:+ start:233 stop:514 length:282 start_codon:yes stop_codon:yes gene_type:complete
MNVKETIKSIESLNNRIEIASKNAVDLINELLNDELLFSLDKTIGIKKHLNLSKEAIDNAESCTREAESLIGSALIEIKEAESRVTEALKLLN